MVLFQAQVSCQAGLHAVYWGGRDTPVYQRHCCSRGGSTQVSQFMTQDSLRRHGAAASSLAPPRTPACVFEGGAVSPTASCAPSAPASPVPLHAIPDVRRPARSVPDVAETALVTTTATLAAPRVVVSGDLVLEVPVVVRAGKAGPFGWRAKFLRKYRALRAHSAHQAHI